MLTLNFNPFHDLETERLLLRRVDNNDYKELIEKYIRISKISPCTFVILFKAYI